MEKNTVFDTAADFVNNTSRSIFLTGKAGTGKTTFLKYIRDNCKKRSVVVAPTGVAAINAGGVTMHSFFQLPLGPFVPSTPKGHSAAVTDKHTLFRNLRVGEEKRQLFRDLELLVIDEISMVRCDSLDAIDAILRFFRKQPHQPFGGVQVLFIGDLFQLPPVMPEGEWSILKDYYASEFFFHSRVIEQSPPLYIELKKIYRQNEQSFIDLLNHVRNNVVSSDDLELLNRRMGAPLQAGKKYITLTSHNYKADKINQEELGKLSSKRFEFKGTIEGDFQERALPTDVNLELKEGAQIMFIRNDTGEERKYFNGKLAVVKSISEEGVWVEDAEGKNFKVEKETWNNIRYSYNSIEKEIVEEKLGSFSQFPIRLAWAITIHKSQGLTFEHAILDTAESFAPGQVYVALSRCVSLGGIILRSPVVASSIRVHPQVAEFAKHEISELQIEQTLKEERVLYQNIRLVNTFRFGKVMDAGEHFLEYAEEKADVNLRDLISDVRSMFVVVKELEDIAGRFRNQLETLLRNGDREKLQERVASSIEYFTKIVSEKMLTPLSGHIESLKKKKKVKTFLKRLTQLQSESLSAINEIRGVTYEGEKLFEGPPLIVEVSRAPAKRGAKIEKGSSTDETLKFWRAGLRVKEISRERGLAVSTIETHLAQLVGERAIDVFDFMTEGQVLKIEEVMKAHPEAALSSWKNHLGSDFSYGQILAVKNYVELKASAEVRE